jgi:signal transduction histidine kinase
MVLTRDNQSQTGGVRLPGEQIEAHRQSLALTALTKLAEQFAERPGFGHLVESLVLTLSGQFGAPSAFASVHLPGSHGAKSSYFGTGRLQTNEILSRLDLTHDHRDYFQEHSDPQLVDRFEMSESTTKLRFFLSECNIAVVVPLLHHDRLIGIIGLGEKASRKPFEAEDIELLQAMITSLAPFLANAFIFEEMSEMGRWYLEILNGVRQGVLVFDRNDQLIKINRAGHRMLRAFKPKLPDPESLDRVSFDWIFSELAFKGWASRLLEARHQRDRQRIKGMTATKGGYKRIFTVQVTGIEGGSIDGGYIVTLDDVTDTAENERRMFDLERFADKGVMASSIAHELNNFLGLILGGVEMAKVRLASNAVEKAAGTLDQVKIHIGQMARFTKGLMDYGKLTTRKTVGNLNTCIADVLSFVGVQQRYTGIAVKANLEPNLPEFGFDPDELAQLMLNLLGNAADSIQQANPEFGQITISTSIVEDMILLSIADNGVGIDPKIQQSLFKRHLTTKENGHGYGLVTCAKILKNHEATVNIVSVPNEGATFEIRFALPAPGNATPLIASD